MQLDLKSVVDLELSERFLDAIIVALIPDGWRVTLACMNSDSVNIAIDQYTKQFRVPTLKTELLARHNLPLSTDDGLLQQDIQLAEQRSTRGLD
jgi:hypothetical protein